MHTDTHPTLTLSPVLTGQPKKQCPHEQKEEQEGVRQKLHQQQPVWEQHHQHRVPGQQAAEGEDQGDVGREGDLLVVHL